MPDPRLRGRRPEFADLGRGRRRQLVDGGGVGRASPPFSRHRPSASFSIAPRAASRRKRSQVVDRLVSAARASADAVRPGFARIAASSRRSA